MRKLIFALFIGVLFSSCGSEPTAKASLSKQKISKITATSVQLEDGTSIPIPLDDGVNSTIFIVRPGEYFLDQQRNLAGLTPNGQNYALELKNLFKDAGINYVLGIGTRYGSETVQPTAEAFGTEVLTFNNTDYGAFLDYVFVNKKGKRFVVTETHERIPEMLRTITPGKIFPTFEKGIYNKLYMVVAPQRTRAVVHELYF